MTPKETSFGGRWDGGEGEGGEGGGGGGGGVLV